MFPISHRYEGRWMCHHPSIVLLSVNHFYKPCWSQDLYVCQDPRFCFPLWSVLQLKLWRMKWVWSTPGWGKPWGTRGSRTICFQCSDSPKNVRLSVWCRSSVYCGVTYIPAHSSDAWRVIKCVAIECRGERWESLQLISLRKLNIDQPQNPTETHDCVLTENLQSLIALYDSNYAAPF